MSGATTVLERIRSNAECRKQPHGLRIFAVPPLMLGMFFLNAISTAALFHCDPEAPSIDEDRVKRQLQAGWKRVEST